MLVYVALQQYQTQTDRMSAAKKVNLAILNINNNTAETARKKKKKKKKKKMKEEDECANNKYLLE